MFSDNALRMVLRDMEHHIPTIDLSILLEERPDLVRKRSHSGYPLHDACRLGLPVSVIRALVERFPDAVAAVGKDSWCQTPLFEACYRNEPQGETICYLVKADPFSLRGTATRPPLLHFCMSLQNQTKAVWISLVYWVWSQYPEAGGLPDYKGRYVIHDATPCYKDADLFRKLLLQTPASCLIDDKGNHILHLAVIESMRVPQNLTSILEECPTAVTWMNHKGELPVHVAVKFKDRNLLINHYPFAMLYMTHDGATVLGNARRKMEQCLGVNFLQVGDVARPRGDEDWELPDVKSIGENRVFFREFDRLINILTKKVLPPLKRILSKASQFGTGTSLPPEVVNEILLFAVPHYEEAVRHTPYCVDTNTECRAVEQLRSMVESTDFGVTNNPVASGDAVE